MPSNNPRLPKRSWRGEGAAKRPQAQKSWRDEPAAAGKTPRLSRRTQLILAVGLFLLVAAVITYYLLMPVPVTPPRLVLVGAGYEENLAVPPNVYGLDGLDGLEKWAGDYNTDWGKASGQNIEVKRKTLTGDEGDDPVADALKGCNSKTVVVFLTAHGDADGQGSYLLPENGGDRDLGAVYRLSKVLDALEKLPAKTNKLLLIDAAPATATWTLGEVHNDFIRSLKGNERVGKIPHLVVLCSNDVDQQSWVAEEFGQTVFAHFVIEGLRGAANKHWEGEDDTGCDFGDNRVSALELAHYVQFQVERWVRHTRGKLQTPLPLGDTNVAAAMELVGADASAYQAPDPAKAPEFTAPKELEDAWQERQAMDQKSFPHPSAYAPHLWRRYQAALLRYEYLLRAGDAAGAGTMNALLSTLHKDIVKAQSRDLDAVALSLKMPAALGWSLPEEVDQSVVDGFKKVWPDKDPEKYRRLLTNLQDASQTQPLPHLVRLRLIGLLLDKVSDSHGAREDFNAVCAILPRLADPTMPRPAEANFAFMLQRTLPANGGEWPRIQQALQVRLRAEAAVLGLTDGVVDQDGAPVPAYSEQVLPWVQNTVAAADVNRRLGEDLLFASVKEDARAAEKLIAADKGYASALENAAIVRRALATRDRALADLPYYTRWLSRQSLKTLSPSDEKDHVALWAAVHDLAGRLEARDFDHAGDLAGPTDQVNKRLAELRTSFRSACDKASGGDLQQNWHDIDELLAVPFIEPKLRSTLIHEASHISHELAAETTDKAGTAGGETPAAAAASAKDEAFRQARLAIAVLGAEGKEARPLLPPEDRTLWQPEMNQVAEQIGKSFQRLARDAADDAETGRKAPLGKAGKPLREGALLARRLNAGAVAAWLTADPVEENRRVQLHNLFVWQAERAYLDYWASEDLRKPYYKDAVGKYADAAEAMAAPEGSGLSADEKKGRLTEVEDERLKLKYPDDLIVVWRNGEEFDATAQTLQITDESLVQRTYALKGGAKGAPPGYPVVWADTGKWLKAPPADAEAHALNKLGADPKDKDAQIPCTLTPDRPTNPSRSSDPSSHSVRAVFRGRRADLTTPVKLYYRPDFVPYVYQPPPTAHLAVRASEEVLALFAKRKSELVIVMDYSGSMGYPLAGEKGPRFKNALKALEKCLSQVPKGVKVSLLTFSQKQNGGALMEQWKQVEWDPSRTGEYITKLDTLEPRGRTPLVESIVEAKKWFTNGFKGSKSIVVLTDGGESEFELNEKDDDIRARKMKEYLRSQFDKSGVRVNVVGFGLDQLDPKEDAEEIRGLKAFQPAVESLAGGTFTNAKNSSELADKLAKYLLKIRFWVESEKEIKIEGLSEEGLAITHRADAPNGQDEPLRWVAVPPGRNYIRLEAHSNADKNAGRESEPQVWVNAGDNLVLNLVESGDDFALRREVYSDYAARSGNTPIASVQPDGGDWVLSVMQNKQPTRDSRQLMVAVERRGGVLTPPDTVREPRPRMAWLTLATPGDPSPLPGRGLRFYPLWDYPAPAWSLDASEWPGADNAVLDAWWWIEDDPLPGKTLRRGFEYTDVTKVSQQTWPVHTPDQDVPVTVESVTWEHRPVQLSPDKPASEESCLVVRLRYPDGKKPFFAQLPEGMAKQGTEDRFFTEAGKYTGIFWSVSEEDAKKLESLTLVSEATARARAVHLTRPLEVTGEKRRPDPIRFTPVH